MNIYFISGKVLYPIGDAGAVVVASSPKEALSMVTVTDPSNPVKIGTTSSKKKRVVFENTTNY